MRYLFLISLFIVASCSSNENTTEEKKSTKLGNEDALEAEIKAIEAEITERGQLATSLRYTKENDAYIVVNAHLNESGKIIKVEEEYSDGTNGNNGTNAFYLKDDQVFATREYFSDIKSKKAGFVDRISYYDKNQKVTKSKEKRVNFEEELENVDYVDINPVALTIDRAKRVLDQKEEFETTFQGFVVVNPLNYMIVGAKNSEGYVSSLRVDYDDEFIKMLMKDQKKYFNHKIAVNFQNIVDPTGMQYQGYISGKMLD